MSTIVMMAAVPVSQALGDSFVDDLRRLAAAQLDADPMSAAELQRASRHEATGYTLAHSIAHLYDDGDLDGLLDKVLDSDFLAAQADRLHGFQTCSRDFETYVLPAAIESAKRDPERWPCFLRLALMAANFRGLADALADEEILEALVRHGQLRLARDVAAQLADPMTRARALSVILASSPDEVDDRELLRQIEEDLDLATGEEGATPERLETLRSVAWWIGPRLQHCWARWLEPFETAGDEVWQSVAEAWIRADGWTEPGLLEALVAMGDRERLLAFLPPRFAVADHARTLLARLEDSSLRDPRLVAYLKMARICQRIQGDDPTAGEAALTDGRRLVARPLPWDVGLAEFGSSLWPRLGRARLVELAKSVGDPTTQAALWVTALEQNENLFEPSNVLEAVGAIDDVDARLHWSLRALAAFPTESSKKTVRWLTAIANYLYRCRYQARPRDLARFLDLVARYLPSHLAAEAENVVWAPGSEPQTLLDLVSEASTPELLLQILSRAEAFAAAVSSTESAGFELRRQLLVRLGCRFAVDFDDAESLDRAAQSLLPGEEEDELRAAVIRELLDAPGEAKEVASRHQLAWQVFEGLEAPRLRLLMSLRLDDSAESLAETVRPAALYAGVATTEALADEIQALSVLFEPPEHPRDLARVHLSQVSDPARRVLGLLDLARHALAYQRRRYRPSLRDRTAALQPLTEGLGGMPPSDRLVALTPELVELGAGLGTSRAVAELQEAFLRLLGPHEAVWDVRLRAFETLIARLEAILLRPKEATDSLDSCCRTLANLLGWLTELPARAGMQELREHWHEILPLVTSTVERLPSRVELYLRYPTGARVCSEFSGRSREPARAICARVEALLAPSWLRRSTTPWRYSTDELLARWTWLQEEQKSVVALCGATADERLQRAGQLLQGTTGKSFNGERRALIPLLSSSAPETALELLRGLPVKERDDVCVRLLRYRWIPSPWVGEVVSLIEDPRARLIAEVWQEPDETVDGSGERWLEALGELAAGGEIDPLDPRTASLCRRLTEAHTAIDPEILAEASIAALGQGGKAAAERVLRLWLRCFLGPPHPAHDSWRQPAALEAVHRALELPTDPAPGDLLAMSRNDPDPERFSTQ